MGVLIRRSRSTKLRYLLKGEGGIHTPTTLAAGVRVGYQTSLAFLLASKMLIKIVDMTRRRAGTV